MLEGCLDQVCGFSLDRFNRTDKLSIGNLPILVMVRVKDIIREVDQFADLLVHTRTYCIDRVRRTGNLLKFFTKNGLELFEYFTSFSDVFDNNYHVVGFVEDCARVAKFPAGCASSGLNLDLCLFIL